MVQNKGKKGCDQSHPHAAPHAPTMKEFSEEINRGYMTWRLRGE